MSIALGSLIANQTLNSNPDKLLKCVCVGGEGANVLDIHIDEGANVQLCQSVWGQMSSHIIFRGGGGQMSEGERVLHSRFSSLFVDL